MYRHAVGLAATLAVIVVLTGGATTASADAPLRPSAEGDTVFVSLTPTRLADTRTGTGGVQGPIDSDTTSEFAATWVGGVPADASSVVLNVTVTEPTSVGFPHDLPYGRSSADIVQPQLRCRSERS
jgi:hypothetical protein